MANRYLESGGSLTPPTPSAAPLTTYFWADPTTVPTYFMHMMTEEIRNTIVAAGITPNHLILTQLRDSVLRLGNAYDPFAIGGPAPFVASATQVTLPANLWAVDPATGEPMKLASTTNVAITSSGANGLDAGSEANNTWYYVWLIKHGTNGTVAALLSTSPTSPTLPSGYTHKRLVFAVRNDGSSNFIQGRCRQWGGGQLTFVPDVQHQHATALSAGNLIASALSATSFTDLNCASQVPAFARFAELWFRAGAALVISVREKGTSHNGQGFRLANPDDTVILPTRLDENQLAQYKVSTSQVDVEVLSWTMELRQ